MTTNTIPADPQVVDQLPPDGIEACESCGGHGVILPASGDPADVRDCYTCGGDGVRWDYR